MGIGCGGLTSLTSVSFLLKWYNPQMFDASAQAQKAINRPALKQLIYRPEVCFV